MDHTLYSALGAKCNSSNKDLFSHGLESKLSLATILAEEIDLTSFSQKEIILAFCYDIKDILQIEDLNELVQAVLTLDSDLNILREELASREGLPHLDHFFRQLSPLLMKSFIEFSDEEEEGDSIYKGWIEAIRIALEEEIYLWQEKTLEKN